MSVIPFIERARAHRNRPALLTDPVPISYGALLDRSESIARHLIAKGVVSGESVVALLAPPGPGYVSGQWGIWQAGGIFLPLCLSATILEWEYALSDSQASRVLVDPAFAARVGPLCEKMGIGLSVCRTIIEAHGGRISVEAPEDGEPGSVFRFTLPVADQPAA